MGGRSGKNKGLELQDSRPLFAAPKMKRAASPLIRLPSKNREAGYGNRAATALTETIDASRAVVYFRKIWSLAPLWKLISRRYVYRDIGEYTKASTNINHPQWQTMAKPCLSRFGPCLVKKLEAQKTHTFRTPFAHLLDCGTPKLPSGGWCAGDTTMGRRPGPRRRNGNKKATTAAPVERRR